MESRWEDNKQGDGQRQEGVGGFRGNDQACLSSGRNVLVGTERKRADGWFEDSSPVTEFFVSRAKLDHQAVGPRFLS